MKRLFYLTLAVFFSFLSSCNNLFADNVYGAVNKKYLRVRAKPNTRSEVKETLYKNDRVTVLERSGKWFKIKTSSNKGWVKSKYISNSSFIASDTVDTSSDESSLDKPTDITMDNTSDNAMFDTPVMSTSSFNTKGNSNINQNNNSNKDSSNDTGKKPNQKTFNSTSTNNSNFNLSTTTKSNKILPKMNKTASKDKLLELSNEIDNINNKDEDF